MFLLAVLFAGFCLLSSAETFAQSDLSVTQTAPEIVRPGNNLSYTITVKNLGPASAADITLNDTLPADTTFVSLTQDSGPIFNCTTPPVGNGGTVTCTAASLPNQNTAQFTLTVNVNSGTASGTQITNTVNVASSTTDPNNGNNTSSDTKTAIIYADLGVTKSAPESVQSGSNLSYTIIVDNFGFDPATNASVTDNLPPGLNFVSITQDSGPIFACTTPPVGDNGMVTCSISTLAGGGEAQFTLTVNVSNAIPSGTQITNIATVSSDLDLTDENNISPATTTVGTAIEISDLSVRNSAPESVQAGNNLSYTIIVNNFGFDPATNAIFNDTLPGDSAFVSLVQNSGPIFNCTTPAVGAGGTITCTTPSLVNGAEAQFTLTVNVPNGTMTGTEYTNTASVTSNTFDPNDENSSSSTTTTVRTPTASSVGISGRVLTANGKGIRNVMVVLTDEQGEQRYVMTSAFGYYRFTKIPAGQIYVISVSAKKYSFEQPAQVLNLTDNLDDINFVADN